MTKGVEATITPWFSRPQLIQTLPWIEGGTVTAALSPLAMFFDPIITSNWDKIKGYSKLRGNLHIKIETNASPFHFGALNVSWAPLTTESGNNTAGKINYDCLNSFSGASLSAYGANFSTGTSALMRTTQRMNGYIYPQDCNTLEFNIPFLYPKEFIEIRSIPDSGGAFSTNSLELYNYGTLTFVTAVPLLVAQTLTGGIVTINVFAWMTDVELEGPSFVVTSGVVQSAGEVATSFKDVPIIGGYLAKVGAISKASARVMSLLGMSNYPSEESTKEVSISALPSLASTEINSNSRYLGLAPHSGLSMAPTESWSDELQIDQFGKSPVFLGIADWTIANGKGVELFAANVSPEYYHLSQVSGVASGTSLAVTTTPICHISSLFSQWRGKVKYHFTAIASQYHRGRVRMYYDSSVTIINNPKEGFVFSKVWDITESKNFEFEVPFTASTQLLSLQHPQWSGVNTSTLNYTVAGGTFTKYTIDPRIHNGCVSMQVLNQLLGPNAVGVKIICSVSYEGIEFSEPCAPGTYTSINPSNVPGSCLINSLTLSHDYYTTSAVPSDHKPFDADVYNGEKILSLRTLLHRPTEFSVLGVPSYSLPAGDGGELCGRVTHPREPLSPGEHTYGGVSKVPDTGANRYTNNLHVSAVTLVGANLGYTYAAISPYTFLKGMFAGYRGSFRWRYISDIPATMYPGRVMGTAALPNVGVVLSLTATRSSNYTYAGIWTDGNNFGSTINNAACNMLSKPNGLGQMAIRGAEFNTSVFGNSLTVDVPQYSRFKFLPTNDTIRSFPRNGGPTAKLAAVGGLDSVYDVASDSVDLDFKFYNPAAWGTSTVTGAAGPKIRTYVSCGTDFSFIGFVNTPIIYVKTTLPLPL